MAMLVSSLVDEVGEAWRSYTKLQDPTTSLTSSIDNDDLSFTVSDPTKISMGLCQIDDEMVQVKTVDRSTSTVTLEPWGRAQSNSTAASHASGARITVSPTYPRVRIRDAISGVLQEIFPDLFATDSTLLTYTPAQVNYALPGTAYHVLSVAWLPAGPSLAWVPIKRWNQHKTATTVELEIYSRVQPGADRVRVQFIKNPPSQLTMTDDLETMGYPISIRDVIVLGALHRLATFTESSRVQAFSVEAQARGEATPAGSALNLSRYLYQLFRQRLADEAANLKFRHPIVLHFTR